MVDKRGGRRLFSSLFIGFFRVVNFFVYEFELIVGPFFQRAVEA